MICYQTVSLVNHLIIISNPSYIGSHSVHCKVYGRVVITGRRSIQIVYQSLVPKISNYSLIKMAVSCLYELCLLTLECQCRANSRAAISTMNVLSTYP